MSQERDWYGQQLDDDALWEGLDAPRRKFTGRIDDSNVDKRSLWMWTEAHIDALFEKRPFSLLPSPRTESIAASWAAAMRANP